MAKDFMELLKEVVNEDFEERSKPFEERLAKFRERELREPGGTGTITLNRADFREAMSRGFSVDASNSDADENIKIGRLNALTVLLGQDRVKSLNSFYAMLIEEYIFGPVGGDSPYRVAVPEADETAEK